MRFANVGSTNPEMLRLLADMGRSDVWQSFIDKYRPLIQSYCGYRQLSHDESEEIFSRVIAILVATFGNQRTRVMVSFRGYLRKIICTEIGKLLREKNRDLLINNSNKNLVNALIACRFDMNFEIEEFEIQLQQMFDQLSRIFEIVRLRVEKTTWKIFWDVTIKGLDYKHVSKIRDKSYLAVIQANRRVLEMVRQEAAKHGLFQ